jgi:hypothetical protein
MADRRSGLFVGASEAKRLAQPSQLDDAAHWSVATYDSQPSRRATEATLSPQEDLEAGRVDEVGTPQIDDHVVVRSPDQVVQLAGQARRGQDIELALDLETDGAGLRSPGDAELHRTARSQGFTQGLLFGLGVSFLTACRTPGVPLLILSLSPSALLHISVLPSDRGLKRPRW